MKPLSRTRLFLLEILVNLLVFCVGVAICTLAITNAYSLSAQSRVLTEAVRTAENAAVAIQAADGDLTALPSLLSGKVSDDRFTAWYSREWEPVRAAKGIYSLTVTVKSIQPDMLRADIKVLSPENKTVTKLAVHIYTGTDPKGGHIS